MVTKMRTEGATNLWDGIHKGLMLSKNVKCHTRNTFVVVLSDGEPNNHPPKGELITTKEYIEQNPLRCSLSMFGYGFNLDTNLLAGLTELGGGCFGFIPDCSMIGTIFVNFLSAALSTFCPKLSIFADSDSGQLLEMNGFKKENANLGGIQYGTTRNCLLRFKVNPEAEIACKLNIQLGSDLRATKSINL